MIDPNDESKQHQQTMATYSHPEPFKVDNGALMAATLIEPAMLQGLSNVGMVAIHLELRDEKRIALMPIMDFVDQAHKIVAIIRGVIKAELKEQGMDVDQIKKIISNN